MANDPDHLWRSGGKLEVRRTDGKRIVIREREPK